MSIYAITSINCTGFKISIYPSIKYLDIKCPIWYVPTPLVIVDFPDVTPEDVPDTDHEDIKLYGEWVEKAGNTEEAVRHTVSTHTEVSEFKVTMEDIKTC